MRWSDHGKRRAGPAGGPRASQDALPRAQDDEEALLELAALGFEARLADPYETFHQGEVSFGYIGEKLKLSAREVERLFAERGWRGTNL